MAPPGEPAPRAPHLVGRQVELDRLAGRLRAAQQGQPSVVVIRGAAGVGKSRLVRELAGTARKMDVEVVHGRAYEHLDLPYLMFAESLFPQLEEQATRLPSLRPHAPALARLHLGDRGTAPPGVDATEHERTRLLVAVAAATVALAQHRPLLLVLDDLHWADPASVDVFVHLALRLNDASIHASVPLLLVAVTRPAPGGALERHLRRIEREPIGDGLDLEGLDEVDTGALLRQLGLGDAEPDLVHGIHQSTDGNPLYIQAIARRLLAAPSADALEGIDLGDLEAPGELTATLDEALGTPGDTCRTVLKTAALFRDGVTADALGAVTGLDDRQLAAGLDEATARGILEEHDGAYAFVHPVFRSYELLKTPAAERRRLHRHIADALLERGPAPDLAHHLVAAGPLADPDLVVQHVRAAADAALARGAWSEAARGYDAVVDAIDHDPAAVPDAVQADVLERAGVAWSCNLDRTRAQAYFERAVAAYRRLGDATGGARARLGLADCQTTVGGVGTTVDPEPLEEALKGLGDREPGLRLGLLAKLAELHWVAGDLRRCREVAGAALVAGRDEPRSEPGVALARVRAHLSLAMVCWLDLDLREAARHLDDALQEGRQVDDPRAVAYPLFRLPLNQYWRGQIDEAQATAHAALDIADRARSRPEQSLPLVALATVALARGDGLIAERHAARALETIRRSGYAWSAPFVHSVLASARAYRGDQAGAALALDELVAGEDDHRVRLQAWLLRLLLRAREGDPTAREEALDAADLLTVEPPLIIGTADWAGVVVELAAALDEPRLAREAAVTLARVQERGQLLTTGTAALVPRLRAVAARLAGEAEEADVLLDEAAAAADRIGARPELGHCWLERARLRAATGAEVEAAQLARHAAELFEELGLPLLARPARELSGAHRPAEARPAPALAPARDVAVIVFVDVVGSTQLTEELGDQAFQDRARQLQGLLRSTIEDFGGAAMDGVRLGDGVLAVFAAGWRAIACARACVDRAPRAGLHVHIGIHAGDVIREDGTIFGGAVNVAARICDEAERDEILVSDTVRRLAATSSQVGFRSRGTVPMKGVEDPPALFAVGTDHVVTLDEPSAEAHIGGDQGSAPG